MTSESGSANKAMSQTLACLLAAAGLSFRQHTDEKFIAARRDRPSRLLLADSLQQQLGDRFSLLSKPKRLLPSRCGTGSIWMNCLTLQRSRPFTDKSTAKGQSRKEGASIVVISLYA